ncbi:MAG: hypothetical protein ACD_61C00288G0001 [uncultured bacterium]|nr:MAG: hypothetical protein ACD_61C00288G0001 [uncultured bacterium]
MEKFDSQFHKKYVGGEGPIMEDARKPVTIDTTYGGISIQDVLSDYRRYVGDPTAELPEEILEELIMAGKE